MSNWTRRENYVSVTEEISMDTDREFCVVVVGRLENTAWSVA